MSTTLRVPFQSKKFFDLLPNVLLHFLCVLHVSKFHGLKPYTFLKMRLGGDIHNGRSTMFDEHTKINFP